MTHEEAMHTALGYAWGAEDFSGTRTVSPTEMPGTLAFADAYADGWDAFNADRRHYMTNVGDAYRRWQESGGLTIWAPAFIAWDSGPRQATPVGK